MMSFEIEGQSFVSSRDIDRERSGVREARQRILDNEERKYFAKKEKEEEAFARGDHKWMLPNLEEDLESKKKKKKHKKEKKHKKDKKKRGKSEDEDDSDDWVESEKNVVKDEGPKQERDSFLEFGLMNTYSKNDLQKDKVSKRDLQKQHEEENSKVAASRELNPELRVQSGLSMASNTPNSKPKHGGGSGDGGLAWLLKAFKRAEDQASEGGVSLEDIAEKRWGSLATFLDMVSKARDKASYIDKKIQADLDRIGKQYGVLEPDNASHNSVSKHGREQRRSSSRERRKRSRSRSYERNKRRSRSRSRDRRRSRSRSSDRRRDRSRDRKRSRSRENRRHGHRDRSRSRSGERAMKFVRPGDKISRSVFTSSRSDGSGGWKSSSRKDQEREEMKKRMEKKEEELKRRQSSSESESDHDEDVKEEKDKRVEEPEPVKVLTESEMNSIAAKIVKAEIMGNDDLAAQLKTKLESAKAARADMIAKGMNPDEPPETVVKLKGEDVRQKRKKTKVETHNKGGERVRYFGDDDRYDLKQLFEREKMNTAEDQQGMLSKYAGKAEKTNDDFDVDDMMISKVAGKRSEDQEDIKRKNRAAAEQMAAEKTLSDCKWCIGSRRSQKHLMVSMGKSVYLAVPGTASLVPGHCIIVPMGHCAAGTHLDEDVWNEVQEYRKALVKMFLSQGMYRIVDGCVFQRILGLMPNILLIAYIFRRRLCLHGDSYGIQKTSPHDNRVYPGTRGHGGDAAHVLSEGNPGVRDRVDQQRQARQAQGQEHRPQRAQGSALLPRRLRTGQRVRPRDRGGGELEQEVRARGGGRDAGRGGEDDEEPSPRAVRAAEGEGDPVRGDVGQV